MLLNLVRRSSLGAVLVALTAAAPAAQAAEPLKTVRVSMLAPNALLWSHAVANKQGMYAAHGIKVDELLTSSSPALLQAVSSGSVEAGVSLGDIVLRAIDQGAPIKIGGAIMDRVTLRLVGGKGVTSVAQLAGETVSAGAVEGGTANLLRFQLQRAGVDPRGVKMLSITASKDRLIAAENGQIKGALMTAPFDALAVQKGMKILDVYREPYLLTPLIINTAWANQNPDVARGLIQSLREAAEWIYNPDNRTEAIGILGEYTSTDPTMCEDAYAFLIQEQHALSRTMEVSSASLENLIAVDRAVGANPASARPLVLTNYYDDRFLKLK